MSGVVCLCWAPKQVMLCHPSFTSVCGHGTTYKHVQCHTQSSTHVFIKKKKEKLLYPQESAQRLMSHVVPAQAGRRCLVNHCEPPGWGCGVLRGVSQAPRDPAWLQQVCALQVLSLLLPRGHRSGRNQDAFSALVGKIKRKIHPRFLCNVTFFFFLKSSGFDICPSYE